MPVEAGLVPHCEASVQEWNGELIPAMGVCREKSSPLCMWVNKSKKWNKEIQSLPKTIFPLNYHSETGFVAVIVEGRDQNETVLKCSHFTQKTKHRLTGGLAWGSSPIKNKEKKK